MSIELDEVYVASIKEMFKEFVTYDRMVISVVSQKLITLIAFISTIIFTFGFKSLIDQETK